MRQLKIRQFIYFLLLAAVIWFFNHLSKPVTVSTVVQGRFVQPPDSLILLSNEPFDIPVRLNATGFRLLFAFSNKKPYDLPLDKLSYKDQTYTVAPEYIERALQSELSESLTLVRASIQPIPVDAALLSSKTVAVIPNVTFSFRPNYIALDSAHIEPTTIEVRGVKAVIDTINGIHTLPVRLQDVHESIQRDLVLTPPKNELLSYSKNTVRYSLNVTRFSENTYELPIRVNTEDPAINLLLFPDRVRLICKAPTERLKTLSADDFEVAVHYDPTEQTNVANTLQLRLTRIPEGVFQVALALDSVTFIIERP